MEVSYRFSVISYKIIGAICAIFFAGCTIGAFLARQYPPIAIFVFFVLMGMYLIGTAGSFEISEKFITHHNFLGVFRMQWVEVEKIEYGRQGTIILHGENKRFVIPPVGFWSGKQKSEALNLFKNIINQLGVKTYPSNTADYKIHKNVRHRIGMS